MAFRIGAREQLHHVDVHGVVYAFPADDDRSIATVATLGKYRSRASRSIVTASKEQVDAGFIEVVP